MSKNDKLVIFDFDGTIADTATVNYSLAGEILAKKGYPKISQTDLERYKKMHARSVFKDLGLSPMKAVGLINKMRKQLPSIVHSGLCFPGTGDLLRALKENNYSLGVITSNSTAVVKKVMGKDCDLFDFVKSKGFFEKDVAIRKVVLSGSFSKDNVIYVGDEIRDIEAARKAGVKIISVAWGYNDPEVLKNNNPDALANTTKDLVKLVNELLQ